MRFLHSQLTVGHCEGCVCAVEGATPCEQISRRVGWVGRVDLSPVVCDAVRKKGEAEGDQ
jgi:hypothetical protein